MNKTIQEFIMANSSLPDREIAEKLGVSQSTVARYRSILGLRKRSYTPKKAIDFSGVDLSRPVNEIAEELGCSRHSVSLARMKKGNARHRDIDFSHADWGKTNAELAKQFNCTVQTITAARKKFGNPRKPGRQKGWTPKKGIKLLKIIQ